MSVGDDRQSHSQDCGLHLPIRSRSSSTQHYYSLLNVLTTSKSVFLLKMTSSSGYSGSGGLCGECHHLRRPHISEEAEEPGHHHHHPLHHRGQHSIQRAGPSPSRHHLHELQVTNTRNIRSHSPLETLQRFLVEKSNSSLQPFSIQL